MESLFVVFWVLYYDRSELKDEKVDHPDKVEWVFKYKGIGDNLYPTQKLCIETAIKSDTTCTKTKCPKVKYEYNCQQVKLPLKEFLKIREELPK